MDENTYVLLGYPTADGRLHYKADVSEEVGIMLASDKKEGNMGIFRAFQSLIPGKQSSKNIWQNKRGDMNRKKELCVLGIIVFILVIVFLGAIYTSTRPQKMKFEMNLCSMTGETASFAMDAVWKNDLLSPHHYEGSLFFEGCQFIAYQKAKRANRLAGVADDILEKLKGIEYNVFLQTDTYDLSKRVTVLGVLFDEEACGYSVWLLYSDASFRDPQSGEIKSVEYFGPAATPGEAEKIREVFNKSELNDIPGVGT